MYACTYFIGHRSALLDGVMVHVVFSCVAEAGLNVALKHIWIQPRMQLFADQWGNLSSFPNFVSIQSPAPLEPVDDRGSAQVSYEFSYSQAFKKNMVSAIVSLCSSGNLSKNEPYPYTQHLSCMLCRCPFSHLCRWPLCSDLLKWKLNMSLLCQRMSKKLQGQS